MVLKRVLLIIEGESVDTRILKHVQTTVRSLKKAAPSAELLAISFIDDPEENLRRLIRVEHEGKLTYRSGNAALSKVQSATADAANRLVTKVRNAWTQQNQLCDDQISKRFCKLWWYTKLSEKNTPLDAVWSELSCLIAIQQVLETESFQLGFMIGSKRMASVVRALFKRFSIPCRTRCIRKGKWMLPRYIIMRLLMPIRLWRLINASRKATKPHRSQVNSLLVSWAEFWRERFGASEDVYYGGDFLRAWSASTKGVHYLISLAGRAYFSSRDLILQCSRLRHPQWSAYPYTTVEAYGTGPMVWRHYADFGDLWHFLRLSRSSTYRAAWMLNGLDLSTLFSDMMLESVIVRFPHSCLLEAMTQRAIDDLRPKHVLMYPFEYLGGRAIIQGIRESATKPQILGLQHGPMAPLKLLYTGDPSDLQAAGELTYPLPEPDDYLVDGELSATMLASRGVDSDRVHIVGAPRLDPVWRLASQKISRSFEDAPKNAKLLIAPGLHDTEFVCRFAFKVCSFSPFIRLMIKPHPKVNVRIVQTLLEQAAGENSTWLDRVQIVGSGEIYAYFAEADYLVGTYSSTAIEAMRFSVPVILLASQRWLDLSPFSLRYPGIAIVSSASELSTCIERLSDREERIRYLRYQRQASEYVFEQPDGHAHERMAAACRAILNQHKPAEHAVYEAPTR